ncbi:MAG: ATP-binding protein [Chloroflexota bacterium]|nr:ATP-binding protein [Chloroflexota bacterium]
MKISVCGKGGSGKSSVVALLAGEARSRGYRVLVVDSDESNAGLYRLLGFEKPPEPLMELVGGKKKIISTMRETPPDGLDARAAVLTREAIATDDIPAENMAQRDNLRLVSVGKILQALEGCACPFGVLSREFLKRLALAKDEFVIVDMEAGVEHFGRGVETSVDAVLIVVDPSFESLELADRIRNLATGAGVAHVWAVLNKIPSDEMAARLEEDLRRRSVDIVGCIHHDAELFMSSLDGAMRSGSGAEEIKAVMDGVLAGTAK